MNSRLSFLQRSFAVWIALVLLVIAGANGVVSAQEPVPSGTRQSAPQTLSPDQLDNLVAPIALYSVPLLSQVLVACT